MLLKWPFHNVSLKAEQVRGIKLLVSVVAALCVFKLPLPSLVGSDGGAIFLSSQGRSVFAVAMLCIALWVTEALPFAATALLAFVFLPLTGCYPGTLPEQVTRLLRDSLANPVIPFILGVMLLGVAVRRSGLSLRMARIILRFSGGKVRLVLLGFMVTAAFLGMWITPLASASIMVPVAAGLLARMECRPGQSRFGKSLLIGVIWGSLSGGIATPAGATPNLIVMGFLRDLAGIEIRFLDWMRVGVPALAFLLPCAWLILMRLFPPEMERFEVSSTLGEMTTQLAASQGNQLRAALLLVTAVMAWILAPAGWSAWSALVFSALLFTPYIGFLRWQDAEREVGWGTFLVVAAGIAIGGAAYQSGLARYLAHLLFAQMLTVLPPFGRRIALSWATSLLHALFASNTVTGSIVAPLLIPLAQELGLDVWRTMAPSAYTISLAFLLISESPCSLIAYQTGYFSARDFTRAGFLFTLVIGPVLAVVLSVM